MRAPRSEPLRSVRQRGATSPQTTGSQHRPDGFLRLRHHLEDLQGASISINGQLQACTDHPELAQRVLYSLPGCCSGDAYCSLLWRVIATAGRRGPFTVQVAAAMRRLGWLIIAGSVVSAVVQGFALNHLLDSMAVIPGNMTQSTYGAISMVLIALLPVPALAGGRC